MTVLVGEIFTFERFSGGHELDKVLIEHSPGIHQRSGTAGDSTASAREVGKTLRGRWGFLNSCKGLGGCVRVCSVYACVCGEGGFELEVQTQF